jgi:predicted TIM-barrel fold metal-dependent hydrolase
MTADFPIVDAHQHFWDPRVNYHPWLCDEPPIAFRYGDYRALRRPYLLSDYLADSAPHHIIATVYVETEWDPRDPVGEMHYVEGLRRQTGFPGVAVAQAWLDREDVATVLERQAGFPFVRSIRHKPRANPSPADGAPGGMAEPRWGAGYALLARHGLRFDLQTPWWHLHEAAALARRFPQTTIILNHTGLPVDRSPDGIAAWKHAMAALAACPNAAVKISGLGVRGQPWTVAATREIVLATIERFGVERCMFASNFPVDGLCGSFAEIFAGFREMVRDFTPREQRQLFHDNAVRIYGME